MSDEENRRLKLLSRLLKIRQCPDCTAKGKPSQRYVPAHVNHWARGVIPAYTAKCLACNGRGWVRAN